MTAPTSVRTIDSVLRRNPWRVAAVALLPLMVLGLLLAALWNPQDRLSQVPAAIVNLDEPVEVDGQTVPLGRQLASGLVSGGETADGAKAAQPAEDATNFDWTITDSGGARAGLADGTYSAVVTIPKDFSAAATSMGGDDPSKAVQATVDVSTPPGGRVADDALARVVAATATSVMSSSLTETYVDNVLVGFDQLADGIGQAQDGATQLADGADQSADGADQLADGAGQLAGGATEASGGAGQLADGAGQLADGASAAAGGASELSGGAAQLADGANAAATGADGVAAGASGLADGAGQLAGGASDLADGSGQVADGARGIAGGIGESASGAEDLADSGDDLAAGARQVAAGNAALADGVGQVDEDLPSSEEISDGIAQAQQATLDAVDDAIATLGCAQDATRPGCAELLELRDELEQGSGPLAELGDELVAARDQLGALATQTDQLATGAEGVATGVAGIADGNRELASGLRELQGAAGQVADGADGVSSGAQGLSGGAEELDTGAARLAGGASDLSAGVGRLGSGAGGLASGASELSSGVGELATGADGVASGASELSSGVGELATGADGLSTGAGELSSGVGQLASGASDLSDGLGDAVSQIPTYTEDERKTLSAVVAEPVAAPSGDGLSTGASGPLFAVVALWLGALALLTVFPPVVAGALGSTRDSVRLTLSAFALPALVAVATGAAVGAILAAVEDLSVGGWVGAIVVGALASVSFVAVHQGFVGLLGNLGRGISLLIAVLVIATGVIATVPAALQGLVDLLPVGAAREALTAVVVPDAGGLGGAVVAVVVWALAGLALAVLVTARGRRLGVRQLLRA
ncbi:hypothetical protein GCM10009809_14660 [Isoptericola hypogeus]|uniref:YhgE/Pip domain-containing protein n=1 Tax=Isoptericola hypogeus TaxID=300179 RepID=A0ABP4VAU5_9MICO